MLKKMLSLMLSLILMLSVTTIPIEAASVYNRQKKHIYFVMDDSTSMEGTREYDANYSLQALIAMCDKEDKVSLYFLNSNPTQAKELVMQAKDNSIIADVRTTYPASNGSTPYAAVTTAQRHLTDSVVEGEETEYWLVVLTDGGFDEGPNQVSDLLEFSKTKLANGTNPRVLFISIGKNVSMKSEGTFQYLPGTDIIDAMNEAAKTIAGRVEVPATYTNQDTEITFNVPYPAKNIIVFTQNNEVKIDSYTSGSDLDVSESYQVEYPVENQRIGKSTVCFVKEANQSSIGAGDVTLVFNKPLASHNTIVLIEPAIGIAARFYNKDGQEIDPSYLTVGGTFEVKYSLCDSETKQPLDDSVVGNVNYYSEIDGQRYDSNEFEFQINSSDFSIEMHAELPDGYVLYTKSDYFDLPLRRDIVFTLSNGGNFKADYDKLKDAEGIGANILVNGKPVDETQIQDFTLKVEGTNFFTSRMDVETDGANGRFIIKPKAGFISPMTPQQKTFEVVLTDKTDGSTYTATLNIEIPGDRNWDECILMILGILLALYLICCQIFKKRFPFGTVFLLHSKGANSRNSLPRPIPLWKLRWFEFISIFKGKFDGLKHFADYMFCINSTSKVTRYDVCGGFFDNITLEANTSQKIDARDKKWNKKTANTYKPDFKKLDKNFRTPSDFKDYKNGIILVRLGECISKSKILGPQAAYTYYFQFMTKKELKKGPTIRRRIK